MAADSGGTSGPRVSKVVTPEVRPPPTFTGSEPKAAQYYEPQHWEDLLWRAYRKVNDPLGRLSAATPVIYDPETENMGYTYANDPTVYLRRRGDIGTFLHEVGHKGAEAINFRDWNKLQRSATFVQGTRAYEPLPRVLTANPYLPYPFATSTYGNYSWSTGAIRSFPGIGKNPQLDDWGGPGELFADLIRTSWGNIKNIPPPLQWAYRSLMGGTNYPGPLFAPYTTDIDY